MGGRRAKDTRRPPRKGMLGGFFGNEVGGRTTGVQYKN